MCAPAERQREKMQGDRPPALAAAAPQSACEIGSSFLQLDFMSGHYEHCIEAMHDQLQAIELPALLCAVIS